MRNKPSAKGSKNNSVNRGQAAKFKSVNGVEVRPAYYDGAGVQHGKYMAAKLPDGNLLCDDGGRPIAYSML